VLASDDRIVLVPHSDKPSCVSPGLGPTTTLQLELTRACGGACAVVCVCVCVCAVIQRAAGGIAADPGERKNQGRGVQRGRHTVPHRTGQAEHLRPGLDCPAQGCRTTLRYTTRPTTHDTTRHDTTRNDTIYTHATHTAQDTTHTTRTRRDHVRLTKDSSEDGRSGCHLLRLPSPGALVQSPVRLPSPLAQAAPPDRTRHWSLTSHDTTRHTKHAHDTRTRTTRKWVE
jgi:hypothetical protein